MSDNGYYLWSGAKCLFDEFIEVCAYASCLCVRVRVCMCICAFLCVCVHDFADCLGCFMTPIHAGVGVWPLS